MVDQLVDLSHMRQKMIAKEFAKFVKALYLKVYKLVLENEDQEKVIQVAGTWVEANPMEWAERRDMTIDVALARGEEERQADEFIQLDSFLSQSAGEMYKPENKYHAIRSALKRRGIKDADAWITNPADIPPAQPDPMLMKQIEIEERKVAVDEASWKTRRRRVVSTWPNLPLPCGRRLTRKRSTGPRLTSLNLLMISRALRPLIAKANRKVLTMEFAKANWKWIMLGVVAVMLFTGVWNEFAGVAHVK
jgi:hypothetical protein